jgi:hypothetical protein
MVNRIRLPLFSLFLLQFSLFRRVSISSTSAEVQSSFVIEPENKAASLFWWNSLVFGLIAQFLYPFVSNLF